MRIIAASVAASVPALLLAACTSLAITEPTLDERIDALFAAYDVSERPGYAIGVVRGGELVVAKGYGSAHIAANAPITPDTAFNLASLSKQFTGAATALEIGAGRLDLDDPITTHAPDLPAYMDAVTLGHLVYMTSGLPEYYTLPSPRGSWDSEAGFTVDDAIAAVIGAGRLEYAPGTRWTYSNINYQLLAKIAANQADTDFTEYLRVNVFEPLGMTNSWVDAPIDAARPERSRAYVWDDAQEGWREAPRRSPHYGGSGMFASLVDLAKWDAALYTDQAFGAEFSERMLTTRRYQHDKDNDAFGLVHGSYHGLKTIWYEGGDYGVSTYMVRLPERDETVICLANFGNARCADKARAVIDVLMAFGGDKT